MPDFEQSVAGIGSLADPVRRALYRYVAAQRGPVSRDQAAEALGIPRHRVKFHLDRLEADGLLDARYARLSGRSGPGAGRPAKLYTRSRYEVSVNLPARLYELAGQIMAAAIEEASAANVPISTALNRTAAAHGSQIGHAARGDQLTSYPGDALPVLLGTLAGCGYEPHLEEGCVIMANCPFRALADLHRDLVCRMNHALLGGLAEAVAEDTFRVRLETGENRCCVVVALS